MLDDVTPIFAALSHQPTFTQIQDAMPTIERFTDLLYSRTSNCLTTNEWKRELFCQGRSIDNIPPKSAALWKHTLRSCYVAGNVSVQSMFKDQILPNPENWVWKMENSNLIPHWTDLFEATVALQDLTKYSCKPEKGCRGR